jgi:hypothetical protein
MFAPTRIAWAEFWKAFHRNVGTPAAWDFLWLTLFFALSSFLVFLGWSARQGIWERFEQVLLGALPDSGPPVRVTFHFDRPEKFTAKVLAAFKRDLPDLSIVPMRGFDQQDSLLALPGLAENEAPPDIPTTLAAYPASPPREDDKDAALSWGRSRDGGEVEFRSFAMPLDSPIWRWVARKEDRPSLHAEAPLVLAASRALFAKHFRYERYRAAVVNDQRVPCVLRSQLPEHLKDPNDPRELKSLVLRIKEGFNRESFQAFDVIWVDSFPMAERVAFIAPLSTVELLVAADERQSLVVHLEDGGTATPRIQKIWLHNTDRDPAGIDGFRQMSACLGAVSTAGTAPKMACGIPFGPRTPQDKTAENANAEGAAAQLKPREAAPVPADARIVPRLEESSFELIVTASKLWPLRRSHVAGCAETAGLGDVFAPGGGLGGRITIDATQPADTVKWVGFARVDVPCSVLVEDDYKNDKLNGEKRNAACPTEKLTDKDRGTAWLTGYRDAMVYVPGRGAALDDVVSRLLAWKLEGRPVFRLDAAYESALVRFGVLSTLIDLISKPLALGLGVLFIALTSVILATAFLHRRAQYGLLTMNGVRPAQIQYIVCVQIALGYVIGCAAGYALFAAAAATVNYILAKSDKVREAGDVIGLDIPRFLAHPSVWEILSIWFVMTWVSILLGVIILRRQGITGARAPIELIK